MGSKPGRAASCSVRNAATISPARRSRLRCRPALRSRLTSCRLLRFRARRGPGAAARTANASRPARVATAAASENSGKATQVGSPCPVLGAESYSNAKRWRGGPGGGQKLPDPRLGGRRENCRTAAAGGRLVAASTFASSRPSATACSRSRRLPGRSLTSLPAATSAKWRFSSPDRATRPDARVSAAPGERRGRRRDGHRGPRRRC